MAAFDPLANYESDLSANSPVLRTVASDAKNENSADADLDRALAEAGIDLGEVATEQDASRREQELAEMDADPLAYIEKKQGKGLLQFGAGVANLAEEAVNGLSDLNNWVSEKFGMEALKTGRLDLVNQFVPRPEADDMDARVARGLGNFAASLATFGAAGAMAKGPLVAKFVKGATASGLVDFLAFDPHEERLSNLMQEYPQLQNPVAEYLAADPNDSNIEGRMKNALEGFIPDAALTAIFMGALKGYRFARKFKKERIRLSGDTAAEAAETVTDTVTNTNTVTDTVTEGTEAAAKAAPGPDLPPGATQQAPDAVKSQDGALKAPEQGVAVKDPRAIPGEVLPKRDPKAFVDIDPVEGLKVRSEEELAKKAKINLSVFNNFDGQDSRRTFFENFVQANAKQIDAARGSKTQDQMAQEVADIMGMDAGELKQKLMNSIGDGEMSAQKMGALKVLLVSAQDRIANLAIEYSDMAAKGLTTAQQRVEFFQELDELKTFTEAWVKTGSEWGRIGKARQMNYDPARRANKEVMDALQKWRGGPEAMDKVIIRFGELAKKGDTELMKRVAKSLNTSTTKKVNDVVFEYWVNGLLSGPMTHVVNAASNTFKMFESIGTRYVGAGLGALRRDKERIYLGEANAALNGALIGLKTMWSKAGHVLMSGQPLKGTAKLPPIAITSDNFIPEGVAMRKLGKKMGMSDGTLDATGNWLKSRFDMMGNMFRIPGRVLMSMDEAFKHANETMEIHALAYREAVKDPDNFDTVYKSIVDAPPEKISQAAADRALENTFQQTLAGYSKKIDDVVKQEPTGLLRYLAPFTRIGINMIDYQLQTIPGLHKLSKRYADAIASGPEAKAMAEARLVMGSTALLTIGGLTAGGVVTGGGPKEWKSKQMRAIGGIKDYSIKIGDKYISYERLAPFGTVAGIAADLVEIGSYLPKEDYDKLAIAGAAIVGDFLTPEFLTESMGTFIAAIESKDPDDPQVNRFITSYASSIVPFSGAMRQMRQIVDPNKRVTKADKTNEAWDAWELAKNSVINTTPWDSKNLLTARNMLGDPIQYPPGVFLDTVSSIFGADPEKNPFVEEVIRLQVDGPLTRPSVEEGEAHMVFSMPQRFIRRAGLAAPLKLSNEQYDKLVQYSAGVGIKGVKPLKTALNELVASPKYKRGSDEFRKVLLKDTVADYYKRGRGYLIATSPEIQDRLQEMQVARGQALLGRDNASDDEALDALIQEELGE